MPTEYLLDDSEHMTSKMQKAHYKVDSVILLTLKSACMVGVEPT